MKRISMLGVLLAAAEIGCAHVRVGVEGTVYVPALRAHESRVSTPTADVVVTTPDEVSLRNPGHSVRVTIHNKSTYNAAEVVWDKMVAITPAGVAHPLIPGALKSAEAVSVIATVARPNAYVPPGSVMNLDAFPGDQPDLFTTAPPGHPYRGQIVDAGTVIVPVLSGGTVDMVHVPISFATDADNPQQHYMPLRYATSFDIPLPLNILIGTLCFCSYGILCTAYLIYPLPGQEEEAQAQAAAWVKTTYGSEAKVISSHAFRLGY